MAYLARGSPARPPVLGASYSTGYTEDDTSSRDEDGESIESLMGKLAIERRVQYGAEKMLDVIEQRTGSEQDQVRARIAAQLEAANDHIRFLEAKLERLRGGAQRRRPQRLNGLGAGAGLSTSASSSTLLSAGVRPKVSHKSSSNTPDRERGPSFSMQGTPSRHVNSGESSSLGSPAGFGRGGGHLDGYSEDEDFAAFCDAADGNIRLLRDLAAADPEGKGKGPERTDEAWECMTRLAGAFKRTPTLFSRCNISELVRATIPFLSDTSTVRRRTAAYRLLRYSLNRRTWGIMMNAGLEWVIVRTFTRDAKAVLEREQALRLLRAVVALPPPDTRDRPRPSSGPGPPDIVAQVLSRRVPLRQSLVRAVVSAAENPDDPMRTVCMETLMEIVLLDLPSLLAAGSFHVVLNSFKDGPFELGLGLTGILMYIVNGPRTRELLVPGSDFEAVLVGLTEEYGKPPARQMQRHIDKLDHCVRNVGMALGSWAGILYMCMDDCRAVKSLISSLFVPMPEMRNALMDLFFSAFRIKAPSWTSAFLDGRRLTVYNRTYEATAQELDALDEDDMPQRLSIVDNYVAFLLAVFVEAGLLEALVALVLDSECTQSERRKATLLLGEILQLANRTLPLQYSARIQALPRLFTGVADFAKPDERNAALAALSSIDSLFRNNRKRGQAVGDRNCIVHPRSVQESLQRSQRQVQQVKLRIGLQVDDKQFQAMINESGVLLSRDHTKWNYETIMDLLQGPLLNAKRLDEVIRVTKFIRRLFFFFHPFNNRFSSILRTRPNYKWVRMGCTLINTMLIHPEGQRYLAEDKLLKQMVDCLAELDQYAGQPSVHPVFARDRLENTLSYGYFEMIGTLSKHRAGLQLLEKFKYFTSIYHLCELRSRDDIIKLIIECFDYSMEDHQRIVLSKALTSSYMDTRLFATHHLARLLQESPHLTDWALQLLVTQLYDPAMEVCEIAVMYLEEACTDPLNLEKVVYLRPTLEHLGDIGANLFLRFMSTSAGFVYLLEAQYIDYELDSWMEEHNLLYVYEVETFVSKTIRPYSKDDPEEIWAYEGTAPTHFFRELCKTPEGCQYLRDKNIVGLFAETVRLNGMESEDQTIMRDVKSALWVLGNIGSTAGGIAFLEDEEIIDVIIEIAEQSPVLTMKGTCFFVIGLISSNQLGAEVLEEYGWVATRTPLGQTTGLCLPNDMSRFAYIEPWKPIQTNADAPSLPTLTGLEGEVMTLISKLGTYVLAAGAMNQLKKIRNRHPRLFASTTLFYRAIRAISTAHFQAPVRRFVLDMFSVEICPHTLTRMVHMEKGSYSVGPPHPDPEVQIEVGSTSEKRLSNGSGGSPEARPRARSSPGPERGNLLVTRARGATVSDRPPVPPLPDFEGERSNGYFHAM